MSIIKQLNYKISLRKLNQLTGSKVQYQRTYETIQKIFPAFNESLIIQLNKPEKQQYSYFTRKFKPNYNKCLVHVLKDDIIAWNMDITNVTGKLRMPNSHQIVFYSEQHNFVFVSLKDYSICLRKVEDNYRVIDYFVFVQTQTLVLVVQHKLQIYVQYYHYQAFKRGQKCMQTGKVKMSVGDMQIYNTVQLKLGNNLRVGVIVEHFKQKRIIFHSFSYDYYDKETEQKIRYVKYYLDPFIESCFPKNSKISVEEISVDVFLFCSKQQKRPKVPVSLQLNKKEEKWQMNILQKYEIQDTIEKNENKAVIVGNWIVTQYYDEHQHTQMSLVTPLQSSQLMDYKLQANFSFFDIFELYAAEWDPDSLVYFNGSTYLFSQNKQDLKFSVVTFKLLKDIYLSFLLQIQEDFDDDLLQDVLQLMALK